MGRWICKGHPKFADPTPHRSNPPPPHLKPSEVSELNLSVTFGNPAALMGQMHNYITSKNVSQCVWGIRLQLSYVKSYVLNCFRICNVMINVASVPRFLAMKFCKVQKRKKPCQLVWRPLPHFFAQQARIGGKPTCQRPEKLEKAENCRYQKHSAQKVGTRCRAVSNQGSR